MLAISTGKLKNRVIKTPEITRPTKSIVKQAVFNIIRSKIGASGIFIDFFSGGGNMGIEAVSNNFTAIFIEKFQSAYNILFDNITALSIEFDQYKFSGLKRINTINNPEKNILIYGDALKIVKFLNIKFDVAYIDPPYGSTLGIKLLSYIELLNCAKDNSIVFFETNDEFTNVPQRWKIIDKKKYGETFLFQLVKIF